MSVCLGRFVYVVLFLVSVRCFCRYGSCLVWLISLGMVGGIIGVRRKNGG